MKVANVVVNAKGMLVVEAVFLGLFGAAAIAGVSSIDWNIHRRYVEKCVASGQSVDSCEVNHDSLTKADRIDFIRDK